MLTLQILIGSVENATACLDKLECFTREKRGKKFAVHGSLIRKEDNCYYSSVTASSPGAGQFPVDAVRRENRGRGGRWLGSEQQSHNAKRSADYQSHNAKCTARDQGAAPGDEAGSVIKNL